MQADKEVRRNPSIIIFAIPKIISHPVKKVALYMMSNASRLRLNKAQIRLSYTSQISNTNTIFTSGTKKRPRSLHLILRLMLRISTIKFSPTPNHGRKPHPIMCKFRKTPKPTKNLLKLINYQYNQ